MKRNFDLLTLGEILLRLSPPNNERLVRGEELNKQVGGAELNVACGTALLGLRTGIISKLPHHDLGTYVKNRVRFSGVSDDYLVYDQERSARLGVYYYENGAYPRRPNIVYDRSHTSIGKITLNEFSEEIYENTRIFHTTGITMALGQNCRDTAMSMMKKFKAGGALVSFDVNFRANLWSGEEARVCIEELLPYVDIFFCSEDTARLTFQKEGDVRKMMKEFAGEYGISIVASTQRIVHSPKIHTFGSVIYDAKQNTYYEEEPYRSIEVIDRIGSGDAYISGVLYGLLSSNMDCRRALEFGNAAGAVKNTIPGDMPSSDYKEIERIITEHQSRGPQSEMNR